MPKNEVKQTYFQSWWLEDEKYRQWLKRHTKDDKVFLCTFCNSHKPVALSNMGERALKSHMKGEKHQKVAKLRQSAVGEVFFMSSGIHAVNRQNLQQSSSTSLGSQVRPPQKLCSQTLRPQKICS